MSETNTCTNCGASVPSAASFCTTCGQSMAQGSDSPTPAAGGERRDDRPDDTKVDTPGLHDSTQVLSPAPPPVAPPSPSTPWSPGPASTPPEPPSPPPPPAPAPPAWQQPPSPQPSPPTAPPAWQQPPPGQAPAPGAPPAWGAPPQGSAPPQSWAPPGAPAAWGGPASTSATASKARSPLGGLASILGGVLTLVGLFTAWITVNGQSGTESGWDLTKSDSLIKSNDPYLILALAIVAIVLGVVLFLGIARPAARVAAIIVGLVIVGVHVRDWLSITDVVENNSAFNGLSISAGFGFYLGVAGGVIATVAGLLPAKKS